MAERKCTGKLNVTLLGMTATIHLPCGREVLLDVEDLPKVAGRPWYSHERCKTHYARSPGLKEGEGTWVRMHHFIVGKPDVPGMVIDHINRDGLDNRKSNLRVVSHSVNVKNRGSYEVRLRRLNDSRRYPGIYQDGKSGSWRAEVMVDGHKHRSKRFPNQEDAFSARLELVAKHCPERKYV